MMRLWKMLGCSGILAAALATAPETIRAADTKASPPATAKDLERIEKTLQKVDQNVDALRKDYNLHVQKTLNDINALKSQVAQLRKDLDALRKAKSSVSNYGPNTASATGRVRLVNDYPYTTQFIVNGKTYMVVPNMEYEVTLPAGAFSYSVPSAGVSVQDRPLAANESVKIQVVAR